MDRRLLVTGIGSGLGHAVHRLLGGMALTRSTNLADVVPPVSQPYDAIIHCAVNTTKSVSLNASYPYFDDNIFLTQRLLDIPHRRFVFISSVDLYDKGSLARAENDQDMAQIASLYAATKLISESLVRNHGRRPLILRPTTLLGPVMRPNSTFRLLTEPGCRLFLSPQSCFNFVLHDDVVRFIDLALRSDIEGVFNIASSSTVLLGDVAQGLGLSPQFGDFTYNVGLIDQGPAAALSSAFARTSGQTLNLFIDALGDRFVGRGHLV